jgi:hypothetical protein
MLPDIRVVLAPRSRGEHARRARDELHSVPMQMHGMLAAVEVIDNDFDNVTTEYDVRIGRAVDAGVGGAGAC